MEIVTGWTRTSIARQTKRPVILSERTALDAATEGKKRGTPRKMETTTLMQVPLLPLRREKGYMNELRRSLGCACTTEPA